MFFSVLLKIFSIHEQYPDPGRGCMISPVPRSHWLVRLVRERALIGCCGDVRSPVIGGVSVLRCGSAPPCVYWGKYTIWVEQSGVILLHVRACFYKYAHYRCCVPRNTTWIRGGHNNRKERRRENKRKHAIYLFSWTKRLFLELFKQHLCGVHLFLFGLFHQIQACHLFQFI